MILFEDNIPDNLNTTEWNFLEWLIAALEPIKDVTEIMSGKL